jgi:hypothetical protein
MTVLKGVAWIPSDIMYVIFPGYTTFKLSKYKSSIAVLIEAVTFGASPRLNSNPSRLPFLKSKRYKSAPL